MHGPVDVKFAADVTLFIPQLRVVKSQRPLLIIGADVLCGGRPLHRWNFSGIELSTRPNGAVSGQLVFK